MSHMKTGNLFTHGTEHRPVDSEVVMCSSFEANIRQKCLLSMSSV